MYENYHFFTSSQYLILLKFLIFLYQWVCLQSYFFRFLFYTLCPFFIIFFLFSVSFTIVFVQLWSHIWLFVMPWTAACQAALSSSISWSLLKFMPVESVMQSNHLILIFSFYLQSFPASGSFPMSWLFVSGGQRIGASASTSVLPMNSQSQFPLGLTGMIFLQSKGLSRVFSNTTVEQHQFFGSQHYSWSNSHIHTRLLEKP